MTITIRLAKEQDLEQINEIYNQFVPVSTATFDLLPHSMEQRRQWFRQHREPRHPVLVACQDDRVEGWASLSQWSERAAYEHTVESSLYVRPTSQRQGIGRLLQTELIRRAKDAGCHAMIAQITSDNQVSIRMHQDFGFFVAGELREVGFKFGRWLDVTLMQLLLNRD